MKTTSLAHHHWKSFVKKGQTLIDATCGGGHDLYFLGKLLEGTGSLVGYDIQKEALTKTKARLETLTPLEQSVIQLRHKSHETFEETHADLIVYNLGYLPGGDKSVVTQTETTLRSIVSALSILNPGGMLSITCYPGHEEGEKEEKAVKEYLKSLSLHVLHFSFPIRQSAPSLFLIRKESRP